MAGLAGEVVLDECQPHGVVRRGDFHFEQLGQACDTLVNEAARLGNEHDRIAAGSESRIAEPIVADRDALAVHVGQTVNRRVGQQQLGAFDYDQEILFEQAFAVHDGSRAEAHLPEQFQGERRHLDALAQRVVVGFQQVVEVGGGFAAGQHALDGEFV
jgi:hypothetical protein